jgi:peroxiredoxin
LEKLGYQLIAISGDTPEKAAETVKRHGLSYQVLSDTDLAVTKRFGIVFNSGRRGLLPVPSVFIVGRDGIIRFQHVNPNYRLRIDPNLLIAAARAGLKK